MTDNVLTERIKGDEPQTAEKSWNAAQRETIDFPGRGLLLSAGAGSGKTATLTEKVAKLVCDEEAGISVSRMLIVTFTVAAAKELKDRIGKRIAAELEKNPGSSYLVRQAVELDSAQISTISSFFYKAVRPYASALSLPPDFRVAEGAVTDVMKKRIMSEVADDFFDSEDEEFLLLADALSASKDENSLPEVLLGAAERLAAKGADGGTVNAWAAELEKDCGGDFMNTSYGRTIKESVLAMLSHYREYFISARGELAAVPEVEKAYGAVCDELISQTGSLLAAVRGGTYASIREALTSFENPRLGGLKSEYKTLSAVFFSEQKTALKGEIDKLTAKVFCCGEKTLDEALRKTEQLCRALGAVLDEFYLRFENEKKDKGLVDFGDLEKYAKRIFCNPDGTPSDSAAEFSKQFDCIFIDEYQDTNRTQDAVFSAISAGMKRFMVGDVKQSIYAFRGADPAVFNSYREKWKPLGDIKRGGGVGENTEATVFMNENFRSDRNVIDFTNIVSEFMFPGSETPFEKEDRLVFSRIQKEGYRESRSEICLLQKSVGEVPDEPSYVAERIASMLKSERRGSGEPYKPEDFAILLRSASRANKFAAALKKRGVPVKDRASEQFFEQPEVLLTLCILNAIDNPLRDIYLAGAMKSPIFGFTVGDMLKLRFGKTDRPLWYCVEEYIESGEDGELRERCAVFAEFEAEFRARARRFGACELLNALYERFSLMSLREKEDDSPAVRERIRRNLTALYEHARQYEKNYFSGLYGFISYLGELMESKTEAEKSGSEENAVTITTIHKSKGLEFPVCFLCETTKNFSDKDIKENILTAPDVGIAMMIPDSSGLVRCATPPRHAVAEKVRQRAVCEEMRILYVAMTRAVERLIVCAAETGRGDCGDLRNLFERAKYVARCATPYSKLCARNYLDWILPAAGAIENGGAPCFDVKYVKTGGGEFTEVPIGEKEKEESCGENLAGLYAERFAFVYPYSYLEKLPAKLTVSKLKPDVLDEGDEFETLESFAAVTAADSEAYAARSFSLEYEAPDVTCGERKAPLPAFLSEKEEADYAFIGTSTHVFLQFCDFENLKSAGFEAERDRLLDREFISEKMAKSVDRVQIESFAGSALMREILASPFVKREFRFNVALPAAFFTKDERLAETLRKEKSDIIVQGVCDLVFENADGELVLVDYKTDRLSAYELANRAAAEKKLRERHTLQLSYYRLALEKIYGRTVARAAVYSLPLGDTVEIPQIIFEKQ